MDSMDQNPASQTQPDPVLSFVFSNSSGDVIFSDHLFARSMGDMAAGILSGVPLNAIFMMDAAAARQLLEAIRKKLIVEDLLVTRHFRAGDVIRYDSTLVAALDEGGDFMGVDLVLKSGSQSNTVPDEAIRITSHSDVIKAYVEMEMNPRNALEPRTFTQSYLVAQFNALQVMLARIGGTASRAAFEKVANNTAHSMALPIHMENGYLKFTNRNIDIQGYRSLLRAAVDYAVNVIGKGIVKREMLLIDKFIGHGTLELISQMDLRIFSDE